MKVYVDELPKDCIECACRNGEYNRCELITPEHSIGYYNEEEMDYKNVPINQDFEELECPLQSLADHTKQVRKEVFDDIRIQVAVLKTNIFNKYPEYSVVSEFNSNRLRCYDEILEILDQIQGETNG